jgi:ketosteroid isomerase-like protein
MVTGEEVKGLEGLESYWKKIQDLIGAGGSYHVTVNVDKTDFYGDAAISRGNTEDVVRLASGKELPFSSRWTAVCRQEDGAWKVIRMQAAMNPVDNVFISLKTRRDKLLFGIGGLVAGAILALAFQSFRRRPRPEKVA